MIETWSPGRADEHMDEAILTDLAADRRAVIPGGRPAPRSRWRCSIACGIRPPARVLDAGCGWGVTLSALESAGYPGRRVWTSRGRALERLDRAGPSLDRGRPDPPVAAATPRRSTPCWPWT